MGKIDREKRELAEEMEVRNEQKLFFLKFKNILNNLATVADQLKAMGQKNTRKIIYFGISGDENVEKRPESEQQKKSKELIAIGQLLLGAQSRANALRAGLTSFTLRMERGRQFQKTVDEVFLVSILKNLIKFSSIMQQIHSYWICVVKEQLKFMEEN